MPKRLKETMIRSDFHMHTAFSTDSEEAVESMLNRAVERGLYSVCITDHMDDEMGESAFRLDTENYFPFLLKKKKEYEERIQVRIGIELGLQKHLGTRYETLIEKYPFFSASTIPANTYNNKEDVESVFVYNIMLVNKDVSDDMVYDMLDCIFSDDGIATIKASHNTADKNIDVSFGVDDVKIPLHDGAAKWWQDHGYETPEN